MKTRKILVTGAGGFIGGHLVKYFLEKYPTAKIRAVDVKPLKDWYQISKKAQNLKLDLRDQKSCAKAVRGMDEVYNLAADMGGIGFIENNKAACMMSVLINTFLLAESKKAKVKRYFFSSTACVYNGDKQKNENATALREEDAYPAMPEDGYGWEKLFSERLCRHYAEDYGMVTRVARLHNVYGPYGTWDGGREKAPAAICRKVGQAVLSGKHSLEIWGDGNQTRSFMYIDDCLKGIEMIMNSNITYPINLGSSELVSINELVSIAEGIAGVKLERSYNLNAPKGVRGRNSDNTKIQRELNWQPNIRLRVGMEKTYRWIHEQMQAMKKGKKSVHNAPAPRMPMKKAA